MEVYNAPLPFPFQTYKKMIANIGEKGVLIMLSHEEAELVVLALSSEIHRQRKVADIGAEMCSDLRRQGVSREGSVGAEYLDAATAKIEVMNHTVKRLQAVGGWR